MRNLLQSIFFVFMLTGFLSCGEIIEPSVSKEKVHLLAPGNLYTSSKYEVTFWFDQVENALLYRLQIVSPAFDSIGSLVADTPVTSNKFSLSLEPGIYQWRVRAENGSSKTNFSEIRTFFIAFSSITQQKVSLISPSNQQLTNTGSLTFKWSPLFGATQYRLQIDSNRFEDENNLMSNKLLPVTETVFSFPKDQSYQWRVRAENDTTQSLWSAVYQVTLDRTPPPKVNLILPQKETTQPLPVSLRWGAVSSVNKYKIYVYKSDSLSLYEQYPRTVTTSTFIFSQGSSNDKVYWKVSAIDAAGNESEASELRNFIIQ